METSKEAELLERIAALEILVGIVLAKEMALSVTVEPAIEKAKASLRDAIAELPQTDPDRTRLTGISHHLGLTVSTAIRSMGVHMNGRTRRS